MQATLFVSAEAMTTVNAIKDLDYYSRVSLSDEPETDLTSAPGYFLNTNALHLAELPAGAEVAIHLTPADQTTYRQHVSVPANLRGVIFSGAPNLPPTMRRSFRFGRRWCQPCITARPCTSKTR